MPVDEDSMMRKRWRQPVFVSLAVVTLCFVLPYLAHASGNKSRTPFRLALPASPFSFAAVADFNSDAKPDIAIADRTGSGSQGYTYRLQVGLSFEPGQVFHFRSPHSAMMWLACGSIMAAANFIQETLRKFFTAAWRLGIERRLNRRRIL